MTPVTVANQPETAAAAVLAVVAAAPRYLTARQISDRLASGGYEWPVRGRQTFTRVTYERVYSTLVRLERRGQVRRVRLPNDEIRWKAARP